MFCTLLLPGHTSQAFCRQCSNSLPYSIPPCLQPSSPGTIPLMRVPPAATWGCDGLKNFLPQEPASLPPDHNALGHHFGTTKSKGAPLHLAALIPQRQGHTPSSFTCGFGFSPLLLWPRSSIPLTLAEDALASLAAVGTSGHTGAQLASAMICNLPTCGCPAATPHLSPVCGYFESKLRITPYLHGVRFGSSLHSTRLPLWLSW